MVVEFDPEALQQFLGLFAGQSAAGDVALVERRQMLVQPAGAEGVPGVDFAGDAEMDEPVHLQRLLEALRPLRRHDVAVGGNLQQFGPALRTGFASRQLAGICGITPAIQQDGVTGDVHRCQLDFTLVGQGIVQKIEFGQRPGNLAFEVEEAFGVDFAVQNGVAGAALLHELGEDAAFIAGVPFGAHVAQDRLPQRAVLPIGDDGFRL